MVLNKLEDVELSSDDEEIDIKGKKRRHKKLLKDIELLSGKSKKRSKKSTRNEPSKDVSEFSWTGSSNKLQLHELVGSLQTTNQPIAKMKKKLRKMDNTTKVLKKPLTKPETERIERTVAYQDTANDISKWNPMIQKNREAEQLTFPMNRYKAPPVSTTTLVGNFKPQNDLEREISAVLQGSKHLLERKDKELTEAEETALKNFDLQEALERRKELQRTRALQSYYETKCRRMKKIKSKKYHRIMKREQQNALGKIDIETLSKENPELFQSELEKAEKMRAMERANLRHRNTSKWAKNLITKGRKTKEDQERIREQLRISRQLTNNKVEGEEDEEDDKETGNDVVEDASVNLHLLDTKQQKDNPWLLGAHVKKDDDSQAGPAKLMKKLQPIVTSESLKYTQEDEGSDVSSGDEWDEKDQTTHSNTGKNKKERAKSSKSVTTGHDSDGSLESDQEYEGLTKKASTAEETAVTNKKIKSAEMTSIKRKPKPQADPLRFLNSDKDAIELITVAESSDDEEIVYDTDQRLNIREAFANDDVIGDFVQEKIDLAEKLKPKAIDLTLPGWGEWAGAGLAVSNKKRKRFTKEAEPAPKRKDERISNVIISETRNKKLAGIQVGEVPFPYSSKDQFERSMRQPIGDMWNTPSVHNKLIEPRIQCLAGNIIDPIKPSRRMKKKSKNT